MPVTSVKTDNKQLLGALQSKKIPKIRVNPLAGRATFLSHTVHGRSDNIVVWP